MVLDGGYSGQLQLAWDYFGCEVTFADEVRHDIHVLCFHHSQHFAQARLFFPKSAMNLGKYATRPDFIRVHKSRYA